MHTSLRSSLLAAVIAVLTASVSSYAQSPAGASAAAFLGKDAMQKLVSGKEVTWYQTKEGITVAWKLSEGGGLNASMTGTRNRSGRDSSFGKWELSNKGVLCIEYNNRRCSHYSFRKEGDKYLLFHNRRAETPPVGEVVSIK